MYVCTCIYLYCMYVCIYVCMRILAQDFKFMYVYVCTCIYLCFYTVCMYVCMHVCMCVYIRRHHLYEYFFICKALELGGKNSNVGPGRSKFKDQS